MTNAAKGRQCFEQGLTGKAQPFSRNFEEKIVGGKGL